MRLTIKILLVLTVLQSSLAFGDSAKQGLLNKLLSPGALIVGHQELEHIDCLKCHDTGKGVPDVKCLDCHKEIKKSIKKKNTFHANVKKDCFECHSDHKGREFDSTKVDEKKFDHIVTGHELHGKHAEITCKECHKTKRTKKPIRKNDTRYFGSATTCKACHKDDNKHFFPKKWNKKDCDSCHNEKKWSETHDFDHTKDAKFKLEGKHTKLKCAECHSNKAKTRGIYKWKNFKKNNCLACHKDQHKRKFSKKFAGKDCTTCHTQQEWAIKKFDHSVTKFLLKGEHKKAKCSECHTQSRALKNKKQKDWSWKGVKKNCYDCHKDQHGFGNLSSKRFGKLKNCQSCHNENGWKKDIDFNHNFDTKWQIQGKHKLVACFQCHIPSKKHLNFKYVKGISKFNKKKANTRIKRKYHWKNLKFKSCNSCHANPHLKTFKAKLLKKKCSECHNEDNWHTIRSSKGGFSHSTSTRFKITGKHKKLKCNDCHLPKGRKKFKFKNAEKQFCVSCHKNVHKGQFHKKFSSKSCVECHTTNSFKKLKKFNHKLTRFKLTGKHKKIAAKCNDCHKPSRFILRTKKPRRGRKFVFNHVNKKFCNDCHKNEHKGQFSKKLSSKTCTTCHNTSTFRKIKKFNHKRTRFPLKLKHKKVKCDECHKKTRKRFSRKPHRNKKKFIFRNLSRKECSTCHKDFHKGNLGNACSECHTEASWKKTADFHKDFTLNGVHYALQCNECHVENRSLEGMSDNCFLCHQKDDVHQGTLPECGSCHKQQFWENSGFKHSLSSFPLRGSHRVLDCSNCHRSGIYESTPSECINCHMQDAQAVTFPNHSVGGFTDCSDCHNQFTFDLAL